MILWKSEDPVQITSMLNLPGFRLTDFQTSYASQKTQTGEYSMINLSLTLEREVSIYLLTVFVPVTMLVIVSWFGFLIAAKDQFLKSAIPLLTLFTLVIALVIWDRDQPRVSYTKAIDVWLGTCVTFIFVAFIETVLVYLMSSSECDRKTDTDQNDSADKSVSRPPMIGNFFCLKTFY